MKQIKAFDGQVIFHIWGSKGILYNALVRTWGVVFDALTNSDMPEAAQDELSRNLSAMVFNCSATVQIDFHLNPANDLYDELLGLQMFWQEWKQSKDYVDMFMRYAQLITPTVNAEWYDAYTQGQPPRQIAAPNELTTPPEQLDPEAESVETPS